MNRRIEIARNITAEILNYLLLASAAYVFIADFAGLLPPVKELIIFVLLPLGFYGLREWCDKLWLFLGLHLLAILLFALFYRGEAVYKAVFLVMLVIDAFLSIGKRVHSQERGMEVALPPAAMGVYLALYLLDSAQGNGANGALLLQLMICFAAGYFIYYFLLRFLSYVDVNARTTENIPVKNVFYSAVSLALGFTAMAFLMITVLANRSLIEKISAGLKQLVRWILSFIQIGSGEVNIEPEVTTQQGGGGFPDLGEVPEPSLFMQILDIILITATLILILILIFYALITLMRKVKEGFHQKGYKHGFEETEYVDRVERIERKDRAEKEQRKSLGERWRAAVSPEERMRRIFKKWLLKSVPSWEGEKWENLLEVSTARECCLALYPEADAEALEFAGLYEKARYGSGLCIQSDVQRMKELAEILHKKG